MFNINNLILDVYAITFMLSENFKMYNSINQKPDIKEVFQLLMIQYPIWRLLSQCQKFRSEI